MPHLAGLIILFLLAVCVHAAPAKSPAKTGKPAKPAASTVNNGLDSVRIHDAYLNGDFDLAIDMIEATRKHGGPFTHSDSIFIFKHLGVMYAARAETRELGKQNMMKLLQTEPTARIMDMYASDMIYMIFKNIQDEFEVYQQKLARAKGHLSGNHPETSVSDPESKGGKPPKTGGAASEKPSSHAWIGWTAAALAAAGGVTLYVFMADEPKTERKVNVIQ